MIQSTRSVRTHHAYWMVPLSVPTIIFTVWLLSQGERGATVAQILSVPIGVYGLALVVASLANPHSSRAPVGVRTKVITASGILLVGAILPLGALLFYDRYLNLEVQFGDAFSLDEQHSTSVTPRINRPRWRGDLAFTPYLSATGKLTDCVQPAQLLVTPVADGQRLGLVRARQRSEAVIVVPEGTRALTLDISLDVPGNQDCVLDITLANGILRR